MEWHTPYHSETGKTTNHGKSFASNITRSLEEKAAEPKQSFIDRFKKPFMPSTWKWMRTSGDAKVFTYRPRAGETSTLELDIPSQFRKYIISNTGETFNGKIEMDDDSYLSMGERVPVVMDDAETEQGVITTFPSLDFRTADGNEWKLDWQKFSQERKLAVGAWDEDWGYSKEGQPTLGKASMYDKTLNLKWNAKLSWWWILVAVLGLLGLAKMMRR